MRVQSVIEITLEKNLWNSLNPRQWRSHLAASRLFAESDTSQATSRTSASLREMPGSQETTDPLSGLLGGRPKFHIPGTGRSQNVALTITVIGTLFRLQAGVVLSSFIDDN